MFFISKNKIFLAEAQEGLFHLVPFCKVPLGHFFRFNKNFYRKTLETCATQVGKLAVGGQIFLQQNDLVGLNTKYFTKYI